MGFYDFTPFEKDLVEFKTKIETIIALEMGDKISEVEAYSRIKKLMKNLKKTKKQKLSDE